MPLAHSSAAPPEAAASPSSTPAGAESVGDRRLRALRRMVGLSTAGQVSHHGWRGGGRSGWPVGEGGVGRCCAGCCVRGRMFRVWRPKRLAVVQTSSRKGHGASVGTVSWAAQHSRPAVASRTWVVQVGTTVTSGLRARVTSSSSHEEPAADDLEAAKGRSNPVARAAEKMIQLPRSVQLASMPLPRMEKTCRPPVGPSSWRHA